MLRAQRSKEYTFKRIISDFQAFILKKSQIHETFYYYYYFY